MSNERKRIRSERGNFFIFIMLSACSFVIFSLTGMSLVNLIFVHNRLQTTADSIALAGMAKLNDQDRVGQMNNLVKRSRQLVFDSTENHSHASTKYSQVAPLAQSLLEEARSGAEEVERERLKLGKVMREEATAAMEASFRRQQESLEINLPWLKQRGPFYRHQFGDLRNIESNARDLRGIADLSAADESAGFLTSSAHFKGHKNANLPNGDSQLTFKLSRLPASVHGERPLGRLASVDQFTAFNRSDDQLPSSCQVELTVYVSGAGLAGNCEYQMRVTSAAITSGSLDE